MQEGDITCPHCSRAIHVGWTQAFGWVEDPAGKWLCSYTTCPACKGLIVELACAVPGGTTASHFAYPKAAARSPVPPEVPAPFAVDYLEATLVLADSPKASAALSRRCLQNVLRDHVHVKPSNLSNEIDEAIPHLPPYLADALGAVRTIGNFAAHPTKSTSTAEVIDVEPGEAEWCLDVLERLFDFCFVQPRILQTMREQLNAKLQDAGKSPI